MSNIPPNEQLSIIKSCVDRITGIDISQNSRKIPFVRGRSMYYMIAIQLTEISQTEIGKYVGVGHATVYNSKLNFESDIVKSPKYNQMFLNAKIAACSILETESESTEGISKDIKIIELERINSQLKRDNEFLKIRLKDSVDFDDEEEKSLVMLYRQLSHQERKGALFKIQVMARVNKKLNERKPIRK